MLSVEIQRYRCSKTPIFIALYLVIKAIPYIRLKECGDFNDDFLKQPDQNQKRFLQKIFENDVVQTFVCYKFWLLGAVAIIIGLMIIRYFYRKSNSEKEKGPNGNNSKLKTE